MIDVSVLDIKPHPDQATNNPGTWAVKFRVSYFGRTRTFWRWHSVRKFNKNGAFIEPDNAQPPKHDIIEEFWDDAFRNFHGFDFEETT